MARFGPPLLACAAIVVAFAACLLGNGYQVFLIAIVCLTTIVGVGLNVLLGLTGQVSLGHVGFYAIGAYATAILTATCGVNFWIALPLATALAGLTGVALALPALRVAGPYLAMVTIAFGFIVENGAIEWRGLTGGANGMMNIPPPAIGAFAFNTRHIALLSIAITVAVLLAFRRLSVSALGRAMRAVRASETASQCVGLNPVGVRITAFGLSALAAGLAGALFAPLTAFVSPSGFTFSQSILFLLVVIVGGAGSTLGPLIGATIVVLLPQLLAGLAEYQLLFFGAVLLIVLWLAPEGVVGELHRRVARPTVSHKARAMSDVATYLRQDASEALQTRDVSIAFGGVRAVDDVALMAAPGHITSLIGPNGAGKTTLINLLSGFYRPDGGMIMLGTRRLDGLSAHAITRAGLARTFQTSQLFAGMPVIDNILAALRGRRRTRSQPDEARLAESLLAFVGYGDAVGRAASDLPHVDKRLVEIARALTTRPRILLLDEPAAGLTAADKLRLRDLIRRIAALGIAVVLVEHDMTLVMEISDTVVVLDAGRVIASGTPAAVQSDPAVLDAYLGKRDFTPAARQAPPRADETPLLAARALHAGYGDVEVLHGIDLEVRSGELVAVLGANGAGKSTCMGALSGLLRPVRGAISLSGVDIGRAPPHRIARSGLVLVPEGRQVFPELSVRDNLRLGAYVRHGGDVEADVDTMLTRFPLLRAREKNRAGLLSGGEQQMLALARGLLAAPRVLLLDEPSLGLAPAAIADLFAALAWLRDDGVTLVLVDQMAALALALADRAYVIETGRVAHHGAADAIAHDAVLQKAYLGIDAAVVRH
jgi:ABC-type branched-subunit amino acid transport system ATPase component/ABC-type branched-subunit amino acid transport system permease subunit